MTHKEFLVLSTIATAPAPLTQRADVCGECERGSL